MPTSPRGRTQDRERWGECHPRLARAVNGVGAGVAFAAAAVLSATGEVVPAGGVAVLGIVLAVGVVWPRFNVVRLALGLLTFA